MADDDTHDEQHEDETSQREDANLKRLREQAAEAATAKRELVFLKAGVDTDSKLGGLMLKSYDGELTVEAVKAFATELGAIGTDTPAATPEITADERALAADRAALSGASTEPVQDQGKDPQLAGIEAFHARVARGSSREHAAGEFFDRVFDAAARGDQRVLYDPDRFREQINQNL